VKLSSVSSRRPISHEEFYTFYKSDNLADLPLLAPSTSDQCGPTGSHYRRTSLALSSCLRINP